MFENIKNIFKKNRRKELLKANSKDTAKERLHLVLMQDRANVSADFLDLMRKEIIEVIKKYIDIDEKAIDVRLTSETTEDGKQSAPALYANIPILNIKDEARKIGMVNKSEEYQHTENNIEENNIETNEQQTNEESTQEEEIVQTNEENIQEDNEQTNIENTQEETEQQTKEENKEINEKQEEDSEIEQIQNEEIENRNSEEESINQEEKIEEKPIHEEENNKEDQP